MSIFTYNASALGLGGVLRHAGATSVVPSLASVALAPTGGLGVSDVSNYSKDGISFSRAESRIIGADTDGKLFTTYTDMYITNLSLFDRLTAALLQTTIVSTRSIRTNNVKDEADPDKTEFRLTAMIRGLAVDGEEVIPQFDFQLTDGCPSYGHFTRAIRDNPKKYADQFGFDEGEFEEALSTPGAAIRASILEDVQHQARSVGPRKGYTLPVRKFGHVHIGELIVKPGRRRVNLLRIDFDKGLDFAEAVAQAMGGPVAKFSAAGDSTPTSDSPDSGSMTIMSGDSNGVPIWPG